LGVGWRDAQFRGQTPSLRALSRTIGELWGPWGIGQGRDEVRSKSARDTPPKMTVQRWRHRWAAASRGWLAAAKILEQIVDPGVRLLFRGADGIPRTVRGKCA